MEADIQLQINFRSRLPITNQIFEQIYDQTLRGILKAGDQLPTVRELARQLKVNFNTVARAYRLLDEAGILSTQHGRGTYILPPEDSMRENEANIEKLDQLTKNYLFEASELGVSAGEVLAIFQRNLRNWTDADEKKQTEENTAD